MAKKESSNDFLKEFFPALDAIEVEYRIPKEKMIDAIQAGIIAAYKKENGFSNDISVIINEEKQTYRVYAHRLVVQEAEDEDKEISLEDARNEYGPSYKIGDILIEDITPTNFSRIAAQTAKQVILQRITDIKREMVLSEMSERTGEILSAIVRRIDGKTVYVEITGSQMEGIMMQSDQVPGEKYVKGDIIKVYIKKIRDGEHGTQVIVSRSSAGFVRKLIEIEVPEVRAGLIKIENVAREAGFRTKVAVKSADPNIDAVGSCIGNKGVRINAVVQEIGGFEKIDVIEYSDNPRIYIARALSPAPVNLVGINEEENRAVAIVPDDKLSLAIGRSGMNVRLAAKLTGWKIDVKPQSQHTESDGQVEADE